MTGIMLGGRLSPGDAIPNNNRSLALLAPILAFIASALFMIAYWKGRKAAYVALAMVFLVVAVLGLMRRRKMPSV
jgi:hypothetical protein